MPPQSRGFQSKSTPNLPTLNSLSLPLPTDNGPVIPKTAAAINPPTEYSATSPSEPASGEDNLSTDDPFSLDPSGSESEDDDLDLEPLSKDLDSNNNAARRPLYSHGSRSHSHLPQTSSALFPPFYNRPPTPLPPSPSLTSLLRPSFSTHTSRPTTPDSSDAEAVPAARHANKLHHHGTAAKRGTSATSGASNGTAGTGTGTGTGTPTNALTSSFASATPIPRASPKVPTYEYYGFFIYLASSFAFLMYLLWAYLPRPFLHQLGIYYYPNRWWALAVPAWLVILVVYIYVALASYNLGYLTLPMRSIENLADDAAQIAVLDPRGKIIKKGKDTEVIKKPSGHKRRNTYAESWGFSVEEARKVDWKNLWNESTDAVLDVPIGGVCEILYGDGRLDHGYRDQIGMNGKA
ncbi:PIG-P-domain-containing protein [Phyllosticta citrichinensis]|uniref:PIG-P-domain-containing protein n=1 Tax=Phyllosticta citrichinensis TaxID=1130410 RepID=A0ABR1XX57_9PEZI